MLKRVGARSADVKKGRSVERRSSAFLSIFAIFQRLEGRFLQKKRILEHGARKIYVGA